jgi:hypothetical protein
MSLRRLGGALGLILLVPVLTGCFLIQASPNPGGDNRLFGVSCPAVGSCTAVGEYIKSGSVTQTLIETGGVDGTTWSVVPSPSPSTFGNALDGVSCVSTTMCTAVGSVSGDSSSVSSLTLVETWDGTTWSVVPSPSPGLIRNALSGVSCLSATMCTAVGTASESGPTSGNAAFTVVETWDGTTWSVVPSPNPGPGGNDLNGVSCLSTSFCVAVGTALGSPPQELLTLVEMWDGTTWSVVPSPDPSNQSVPINELSGVSCISTVSCTAVGDYITNTGSRKALIESWDGTAWSVVLSPNASPIGLERLTSISCVSISSCTAVGGAFNNGSVLQTLVETFDGTTWSVVPSPDGSSSDTNFLNGVSCPPASSGTCTAVGLFSADTLIIHDVPIS